MTTMKQNLIDSLLEVREAAVSGNIVKKDCGICGNWACALRYNAIYKDKTRNEIAAYILVGEASLNWEHFSGEMYHPVVNTPSVGWWDGENLTKRLSLIDHILEWLEDRSDEDLELILQGYY